MNTAIILAAGKGNRMKAGINKQFLLLRDRPIIAHAIEAFQQCDLIDEIIIVTAEEEIQYFQTHILDSYRFNKVKKLVAGGLERQQSAYNGILAISSDSEIVLIHDGARPFVSKQTISDCIEAAKQYGAASAGMPSKDTIKLVNETDVVTSTPPRDRVWLTQTPQAFRTDLIKKAHQKALDQGISATDDAMLVELMGKPVRMVAADYNNIKITTPEDLIIAEQIINIINKY